MNIMKTHENFVRSNQNKNHKTEHKTKQMTYATLCWFKNNQKQNETVHNPQNQ